MLLKGPALVRSMPDEITTEALLEELRRSGTDLARLVEGVVLRKRPVAVVSSQAVAAWEQRAPEAWAKVRKWLVAQGVMLLIV